MDVETQPHHRLAKTRALFKAQTIKPLLVLLLTYFLLRLFFQQLVMAKSWFIYPSGLVVNLFHGAGEYLNHEWLFAINRTNYILGEPCSGTTFFSLLLAYLVYRHITHKASLVWLPLAYPIAIFANAMRVLSSMHAHDSLTHINATALGSELHVAMGVIAFCSSFLVVAYLVEKPQRGNTNEL